MLIPEGPSCTKRLMMKYYLVLIFGHFSNNERASVGRFMNPLSEAGKNAIYLLRHMNPNELGKFKDDLYFLLNGFSKEQKKKEGLMFRYTYVLDKATAHKLKKYSSAIYKYKIFHGYTNGTELIETVNFLCNAIKGHCPFDDALLPLELSFNNYLLTMDCSFNNDNPLTQEIKKTALRISKLDVFELMENKREWHELAEIICEGVISYNRRGVYTPSSCSCSPLNFTID